jgi:anti-sigma B factor antagonist
MELIIREIGTATVIAIDVDIDAATSPALREQILPCIVSGRALILDVSRVVYMSSAGLRLLLMLYRESAKSNARLGLSGLSEDLRDVMSATGFLDHFATWENVEAALLCIEQG